MISHPKNEGTESAYSLCCGSLKITETALKICSVYGQRVITDYQVQNWFSKFHSGDKSLRHEPRPGHSWDLYQDFSKE